MGNATPFPECKFTICDLPGQCLAEGKCHHPNPLAQLERQHEADCAAMAKQAQDLAAERSKCESLRAQLHGMQDGALLRDTQAALAAERKRADEAIRRLQHMHSAHSDSVQWYQNAVAQALKSLDALPAKLDFEGSRE